MNLLSLSCCAGALCLISSLAMAQSPTTAPTTKPTFKIVLAGDSTVTDNAGWGVGFQKCMNDTVEVVNFAKGGRSSKSFRDEGHWKACLEAKPNCILIQFGHNDQPGKGPERETDPNTTYRENLARYVAEAREIGAQPVLVTSIARRRWDDLGNVRSDLTTYADAVRAVAAEQKVPLIELHDRSMEMYASLGKQGVELISPPNKEGNGFDSTHLNLCGSETFGPIVAEELKRTVPELKKYIRGYIPAEKRAVPTTQPTPLVDSPKQDLAAKGVKTIVVAADGSGEFRTVQEAIAAAPEFNTDRTRIRIKPGVYQGAFVIPASKPNVTFIGDDRDTTILTYALNVYDPIPPGIPNRMNGNGTIVLGNDFHARNLTFRNTSGDHGQAMALRCQADRLVFENCKLLGWQDTLLAHSGRQYFKECFIEGRVDFIYGGSTVVFDRCEIRSKGGYITAASTAEEKPFGYAFLDCKLTSSDENELAYLGRPWRPFAAVAFIRCKIGKHIRPEGWHNWGKVDNEKTARYAEFQSTGPGGDVSKRVPWAKQLSADEAAKYTVTNVLAGQDNWNPAAP